MMRKKVISNFVFAAVLFSAVAVSAQEICPLTGKAPQPVTVKNLSAFAALPVLEQGRIKPVDTYAENLLLQLSDGRRFAKKGRTENAVKAFLPSSGLPGCFLPRIQPGTTRFF